MAIDLVESYMPSGPNFEHAAQQKNVEALVDYYRQNVVDWDNKLKTGMRTLATALLVDHAKQTGEDPRDVLRRIESELVDGDI
ncbi:hypothetical protein A5653_12550 [Mycobacterium colombiense]|nr:hypothetical protein A5653_12550 [Mycobacterium colombiense]